jgi:hypothetical protein
MKNEMKKALQNTATPLLKKKLSREDMKKIAGGKSANYGWICGCIDQENNFYPGPYYGTYCQVHYCGEPWCIQG